MFLFTKLSHLLHKIIDHSKIDVLIKWNEKIETNCYTVSEYLSSLIRGGLAQLCNAEKSSCLIKNALKWFLAFMIISWTSMHHHKFCQNDNRPTRNRIFMSSLSYFFVMWRHTVIIICLHVYAVRICVVRVRVVSKSLWFTKSEYKRYPSHNFSSHFQSK